jgi:hypothetical protein
MKSFTQIEKNKKVSSINEDIITKTQLQEEVPTHVPQEGPARFFSKLFESKEVSHVFHLQVKGEEGSYATHKALGSYYEKVLELIDDLIEVYQGQNDIVEGYDIIDTSQTKLSDPITYFIEVGDFIKQTRHSALQEDDAACQAIVDEILILLYKTLYKLRFNK